MYMIKHIQQKQQQLQQHLQQQHLYLTNMLHPSRRGLIGSMFGLINMLIMLIMLSRGKYVYSWDGRTDGQTDGRTDHADS